MPTEQVQSRNTSPECDCDQQAVFAKDGDEQAFERLFEHAQPKIKRHARALRRSSGDREDLASFGYECFWQDAVQNFDKDRAGPGGFAAYATWKVRRQMSTFGPMNHTTYGKLKKAYDAMEQEGTEPTAEHLRQATNCQIDSCSRFIHLKTPPISIEGMKEPDNLIIPRRNDDPLVTEFILEAWLPSRGARMAAIAENQMTAEDLRESNQRLAQRLNCSVDTIKSDQYTSAAWVWVAVFLICEVPEKTNEDAYRELNERIASIPKPPGKGDPEREDFLEAESKLDKHLRRFRNRYVLKQADVNEIRHLFSEYEKTHRMGDTYNEIG